MQKCKQHILTSLFAVGSNSTPGRPLVTSLQSPFLQARTESFDKIRSCGMSRMVACFLDHDK